MFAQCKLSSICYYVTDISKTETFYQDAMGLQVQNMGDDGAGNDWLMVGTAGGVDLLFFQMDSHPGNTPIPVFELTEGGIDDAIAALTEKGVTIVTPVSHAPGGWSAEFADPDGHVLSMYQEDSVPRTQK